MDLLLRAAAGNFRLLPCQLPYPPFEGDANGAGGADGVEATTDGGSVWAPQLATPEPVEELSFADAEHGWSLTTDELLSTSDGGHT